MATITEDYVSFETAKLLKEKGFDERCFSFYWPDGSLDANSHDKTTDLRNSKSSTAVAPTLQMAMKWLREVHKIFVQIELYDKWENYSFELFQNTHRLMLDNRVTFGSPEEACEAAIKYCLENLI